MQMTNRLARPALLTLPSLAGGAGGSAGCSARQLVSSQSTPGFAVNPELGAPSPGLSQQGVQQFASQPPPVAHEPAAQPLQPHNFDSRGSSQGTSGTGTSTALNQSLPTTSTQAQGTQAQDTVMSKFSGALPCAATSSVQSGSAKSSSVAPASSLAVPQLSVPPLRGSMHVQAGPGDASQIPTQRGALQPPTPPNPDGPQLPQRWGSAHISASSPKHRRSSPSPTRKQQQGWTPAQPWAHLQTQTQPWPQPGAKGSRPANLQQQPRSKDLQAQTPPPSQTPRIVDRTPPSQSLVCPAEDVDSPRKRRVQNEDLDSPRPWTKNDEYCRERKPTDPFYYPTTMSPLTGIGLNAIEQSTLTMKASPKKTDGQPSERPSESPREGLECPTVVDEDTRELRILQEQSDALSRHVQALEQAKSLAAVQSAQALRKIQSRQEAIRREAQAMLSSKELPAEFAISPELIGAPRPCGLPPPTILAGRRSASESSLADPEMHPEKAVIAVGGPALVPAVSCGAFAGMAEDPQETFRSAASVEAPAWRQDSRRDEGRSPESRPDVPQSSPVMLPQLPQTPQSWATPFQKTSGRTHTPTKTHRYVDALGNPLGSSDRVFVNIKDEPSPTPDASPSGVEVCTAFSARGRAMVSHSPFVDALGNPLGPTSERSFPDIKDEHPEEARTTSGVEVPPSLATTSGRSSRSQLHHPEGVVDVESRTSSEARVALEPTPGPSAQERPVAHERAQPLPAHERSPNASRASAGQGSARLRENSGIGAADGGAACSPTSHPARGETQIPQCAATRRRPPSPPPRSGRARDEQEHWEHDPPSIATPGHKRPSSPPASRRDGSIGTARGRRQDENHNRERSVRDRSPRKSMESFLQQEEVVDPPHSEQQQVELEECLDTIRWCAESVTRDSLQDLRNMTKPPAVVKDVVEAVVLLLGQSETRWEKLKRILSSPSFLERIQRLNIQQGVTREQFHRLRERLQHPEFDEELIKTTCVPAVPLATWCRAIGVYLSKTKYRGGPGVRPVAAAVATHHHSERRADRASTPTARTPSPTASEHITFDPDIRLMGPEELLAVKELTICRPDVGTVTFHGSTDCSNLDLEHVVRLEVGEVLVYPEPDLKPPIGSGLNKPATVTLYQCWPPNGSALLQDVRSQEKYRAKIKQMTEDKHARFVDYDCNTGVWKFSVDHF